MWQITLDMVQKGLEDYLETKRLGPWMWDVLILSIYGPIGLPKTHGIFGWGAFNPHLRMAIALCCFEGNTHTQNLHISIILDIYR